MDSKILINLGFEEKEAKIYLAALALGLCSIQNISEKARLKRPTVYNYIQNLLKKGVLQKIPRGKKELYIATDPVILKKRFIQNFEIFESQLPYLKNLYLKNKQRFQVRVLEEDQSIENFYDDLCKANSIFFVADLNSVEKKFFSSFDKISKAIVENEIPTQEIIPNTDKAKASSRRFASIAGKFYSSRIAMNGPLYNDCVLFGSTLAFLRIHESNLFVIVIEEPTIVETIKTIFQLAWQSATPFIGK